MSRMKKTLLLLAASGLWSTAIATQPLKPQISNQSAVTVKATPKNIQADVWEIEVVFDTHSQELKDDLLKNAALIADDGTRIPPSGWKGDPPNGHHRKGVLQFNRVNPRPKILELHISRSGEPSPRIFKWKME
jgi:hypothetical protein